MKTLAIMLALSMTGASALAQQTTQPAAQANTNTAKAADVKKVDEQRKDQSEEITNAKLRAEAGSKSKFSVKANLSYSGGSVERPMAKKRPDYRSSESSTEQEVTSLGGSVALAYRATDKLTARFGTGLSMKTPFHNTDKDISQNHFDDSNEDLAGEKVIDVSTPYLELSSAFRVGNLMLMPSATLSYYSKEYHRQTIKLDSNISVDATAVLDIEGSKFQPGITLGADNNFFQDSKKEGFDKRPDYSLGIYPFIEYAFNDMYSFRTLVGFTYTHQRSADVDTFIKDKVYQSMGLGIAMTKEIYIYPNVQFIPDNIRSDLTNIGVSTTMSVF